jgi:hypothetical protein
MRSGWSRRSVSKVVYGFSEDRRGVGGSGDTEWKTRLDRVTALKTQANVSIRVHALPCSSTATQKPDRTVLAALSAKIARCRNCLT